MHSIVISVFVKDDLIQAQIDNLLTLEGIDKYRVIFYKDNIRNSKSYNTPIYKNKHDNIKRIIENNLSRFKTAHLIYNEINVGPYMSCKNVMDYAFTECDYTIFMEDDVLLAKNALIWFNYFYDNQFINWNRYQFVTGESIFYNTPSIALQPSAEKLQLIKGDISRDKYFQYFIEISQFLTPSIFATTKEIWNSDVRNIRGRICGDTALNAEIIKHKWKTIFPVVPFAKDIGMLHDTGWTVTYKGKNNINGKNTYLMADDFETVQKFLILPASVNRGLFYPLKFKYRY